MKNENGIGIGMKSITMMPEIDKKLVEVILQTPLYKDQNRGRTGSTAQKIDVLGKSPISTNGWDTVFAISVMHLNEAIVKCESYPKTFSYVLNDGISTYTINDGKFGAWQIYEGGDGGNLNLKLPILSGTIYDNRGNEITIDGVEVIVQVKLDFFPVKSDDLPYEDGSYELKVSNESKIEDIGAVIAISMIMPESINLGIIGKAILKSVIEGWSNENLHEFNTVFSTIYLNNLGDSDEFSWLKTTHMSYAYANLEVFSDSVFGVLCMCKGHSAEGLPRQITPNALTSEGDATFIINTSLFVEYQFLPALPYAFDECELSDFTMNKAKNEITSSNIKMGDVESLSITYHPVCETFLIAFEQSYIRSKIKIRTEISPGIVSFTNIEIQMTLKLDRNSDGEQILTYELVKKPEVITSVETELWVTITEVIVGTIVSVLSLALGACVEKTIHRVFVCIVAVVVVAVIGIIIHVIIEDAIADGIANALPAITPMAKFATNQVIWPLCDPDNPEMFELTYVLYNSSIALIGNYNYLS